MSSRNLTFGVIFLVQTTVGILGNFYLLYHNVFLYFSGFSSRSTDLILRHLTVANSMVSLAKGIPQTMAAFGLKDFLNDFGCKSLFYVHRVGRGVSIGSTCLLSIFQAITISPSNSRWTELKVKATRYLGFSLFLCWLLHMLVNIIFPIYLTSNWDNKTIINQKDFGYCSSVRHDKTADSLYAFLLSFPDAVSLVLMLWASGTIVFILHRHKQRLRHIHRSNVSPRSSPETRATHTILVLVSTFVSFYTLSIIFQVFLSSLFHPSWWVVHTAALTTAGYPTISPFVLINRDPNFTRFCFAGIRKTKSPHLIRDT
ncbi:PREDICTED: vomeronasal type-1 receptor 2-like [Chrysochloris asiatica]|uniref:Vomeronasal type-1 receptor n=1 Tax=Chrysochloris asiatica TaxID=185453 RepID=A0A9B0WSD7_CHRAS|nr:PREDICTED: vomeronasal type-1 receptor 2-like [Chrysochloris asiatica]